MVDIQHLSPLGHYWWIRRQGCKNSYICSWWSELSCWSPAFVTEEENRTLHCGPGWRRTVYYRQELCVYVLYLRPLSHKPIHFSTVWQAVISWFLSGGYPDHCVSVNTYILRLSDPEDPGSFHWANGTRLPTPRGGLMCSQVHAGTGNQKVIVAGGKDGRSQAWFGAVEIYYVAEDTWERGIFVVYHILAIR